MKFEKRAVRIFISSTFRDMMPEREHLMKIIFPELRRRCRDKWIELTEVDLRWGILEEEAKEGKVIEICLTEIDKSRPYFIGLLGHRYGWVPSREEYDKHARRVEAFQWVEEDIEEGLSITEMEIQYGVLRNPDMEGNAFFYLKETDEAQEEEENQDRLNKLKSQIKKQDKHPVKNYHTIEELGQQILEDLWDCISRDFPDAEVPDAHALENLHQRALISSHLDYYDDRAGNIAALDSLLESNQKVVVHAKNGTGKSALLSNWMKQHEDEDEIIPYVCGSTADSADLDKMARHLAEELKLRFDISHSIPQKIESPRSLLQAFLQETDPRRPLYLLIDDVDQLQVSQQNRQLRWLPEQLPAHVRLILSTADSNKLDILQKADFKAFKLEPLQPEAVGNVARKYFSLYAKKLPEEQLERIEQTPLYSQPIVLLSLVNELRLFGTHEDIPAQIDHYAQFSKQSDFFRAYLQRLEEDYDSEKFKIKTILALLMLAQQGLSETEIMEISGIKPLNWSQLYSVLDYHLINKNGLLQLSNEALKEAIQQAYLDDNTFKQSQQQILATYFFQTLEQVDWQSPREALSRLSEELPELLFSMQDGDRLNKLISTIPVFEHLFQTQYEKMGRYLVFIRESYPLDKVFEAPVQACMASEWKAERKIALAYFVAHSLLVHDSPERALPFYHQALTAFTQSQARSSYVIQALKELANIYNTLGAFDASAQILEQILKFDSEEGIAESFDLLGQLYSNLGQFAKAEMLVQDALAYSIHRYGADTLQVAILHNNLGRLYDKHKDFSQAEEHYRLAFQTGERLLGKADPFCQTALSNLGILYLNAKQLKPAMQVFQEVFDIRKALYGTKHRLTLKTINSMGVCNLFMEKLEEAQRLLEQAYEGQKEVLGPKHPTTSVTLSNLADLSVRQQKFFKAERIQRELLETYKQQFGETHEQVINMELALAATLLGQEKPEEAVRQYEAVVPKQIRFYGENHPMVKYTRFKIYEIQADLKKVRPEDAAAFMDWYLYHANQRMEAKKLQQAEAYLKQVEAVGEEVFQKAHPHYLSAIDGLAGLYFQWEKYPEAAHYSGIMAESSKNAMGADAPVFLRYKTVTAYNLYKAGAYQDAMKHMLELGDAHEKLLDFPEGFVTKMYRELLGFFNSYQAVIKAYDADPQKVEAMYEEAQQKLQEAFANSTPDNYPETLQQVEEVVKLAHTLNNEYGLPFPGALYGKAQVLEAMGKPEEAIEALTEGIRYLTRWNHDFHPLVERYALKLGEILAEQKNTEGALFFFHRAERINSMLEDFPNEDTINIYSSLVMLYLEAGDREKTLEWIETGLPILRKLKGDDYHMVHNFIYVKKEMEHALAQVQS